MGTPLSAVVLLNSIWEFSSSGSRDEGFANLRKSLQYLHLAPERSHTAITAGKKAVHSAPDDKEEVITKRLEVFDAQTKPLIKHYTDAGLLRVVDADADVDTVFKNIQHALGAS